MKENEERISVSFRETSGNVRSELVVPDNAVNMPASIPGNAVSMTYSEQSSGFNTDMNTDAHPGVIGEHEDLSGREKPDQHPISAISGLSAALSGANLYADRVSTKALEDAMDYADSAKDAAISIADGHLQAVVDADTQRFTNIEADVHGVYSEVGVIQGNIVTMETEIDQNAHDITLRATTEYVDAQLEIQAGEISSVVAHTPVINLLPQNYEAELRNGQTYTENGLTFKTNKDGSVTVSGTATAQTKYMFIGKDITDFVQPMHIDPDKKYCMSCSPDPMPGSNFSAEVAHGNPVQPSGRINWIYGSYVGEGGKAVVNTGYTYVHVYLSFNSGFSTQGTTFRVMLETGDKRHAYTTQRGAAGSTYSEIRQNAHDITLKVSESDYNGEEIISRINLNPTTAQIEAQHIDLQGYVTVTDLSDPTSQTEIDGAHIKTGTMDLNTLTSTAKAGIVSSSSSKTEYYLSTSDQSATGGTWSETIPGWDEGKYLWTRQKTTDTFADGNSTTTYSPSSSGQYDANLTDAIATAYGASSAASQAQSTANAAVDQTQLIYKTAAAGTSSVAAPSSWVTSSSDSQDAWTIKRPTYNSSYPVLFVATQRKNLAGTVSCTTPLKDDTTTVIDGGHITTGTIDASQVTVTNIDADEIKAGILQSREGSTPAFYLDLDNGILKGNFSELTITGSAAASQTYADGKASAAQAAAEATAAADATSKANAAQSAAEATAAADATSKANAAQSAAEATAAADATSKANAAQSAAESYADSAVAAYDTNLNQTAVFNKLTNNGSLQGLYMQNGNLYINATYTATGILKSRESNNPKFYLDLDNGILKGNFTELSIAGSAAASQNYADGKASAAQSAAEATAAADATSKANAAQSAAESYADSAISTYNTSLDQTAVFNKLTDNGALQGLYMQNGNLYINASYIKGGQIAGQTITGNLIQSRATKTYNYTDYSASDITAIGNIILSDSFPTAAELEKYDINNDNVIDIMDMAHVQRMITYHKNIVCLSGLEIDPTDTSYPVKTLFGSADEGDDITENDGVKIGTSAVIARNFVFEDWNNAITGVIGGEGGLKFFDASTRMPLVRIDPGTGYSSLYIYDGTTQKYKMRLSDQSLDFFTNAGVLLNGYPASGIQNFYGTWDNGCVRFMQAKIQIAWKRTTWTGAIDVPWGSGVYESNSGTNGIELGNWYMPFSNHPFISHYANEPGGATAWVANGYVNPSATSAGSVLLERGGTSITSKTWYIYTFAVGTYS